MNDKPLTKAQVEEANSIIKQYLEKGRPITHTSRVYSSEPGKPGVLRDRTGRAYMRDEKGTLRRLPERDVMEIAKRQAGITGGQVAEPEVD